MRASMLHLALSGFCFGQAAVAIPSTRVEIVVEKKQGSRAKPMDPGHVFEAGDLVRFRFKTNAPGYLYVMNRSTAGTYSLLFPKKDTGTENHIQAAKEYTIPATSSGWFRIEGPPGHEIVYWVVTPADLAASEPHEAAPIPLPEPVKPADLPPSVTPRCDDTIFRARGDCVDASAGPKAIEESAQMPTSLNTLHPVPSRELVFIRKQSSVTVSSSSPSADPLIYEFHLAHK